MGLKYLGTICGTYGLNGAVRICDMIDNDFSLNPNTIVYIGYSEKFCEKHILTKLTKTTKGAIAIIQGISDDLQASKLIEKGIFIDENLLVKTEDNSYMIDDIIGCSVINIETSEELGVITDVWVLPANDVWVLTAENKQIPIPVIDDVVCSVDLSKKQIFINVIEGLLEI